jgi:hypothetical protein
MAIKLGVSQNTILEHVRYLSRDKVLSKVFKYIDRRGLVSSLDKIGRK